MSTELGFADVTLRAPGLPDLPLPSVGSSGVYRRAAYWNYVIRNRRRFDDAALDRLVENCQIDLAALGIGRDFLQAIVSVEEVEVSIRHVAGSERWQWRAVPWESMLSLVSRPLREKKHLTVMRHLDRPPMEPAEGPDRMLFVSSAPGRVGDIYDFDAERQMMLGMLGSKLGEANVRSLHNPKPSELKHEILHFAPTIIHLTALDVHQAAAVLDDRALDACADGVLFPPEGPDDDPETVIEADELASILTADAQHRPRLVVFNCQFSAVRHAALAVAAGAEFALGFHDTIDDAIAEQYYIGLYRAWLECGWGKMRQAFKSARLAIAPRLRGPRGGSVVMWSSRSLMTAETPSSFAAATLTATATPAPKRGARLSKAPDAVPKKEILSDQDVAACITVQAVPELQLNYAHLHNSRPIFKNFVCVHSLNGEFLKRRFEVKVKLDLGSSFAEFSEDFSLDELETGIEKKIHLPLVASILRDRRESVQSALSIEVRVNNVVLHRKTHRIALLSADEWMDDALNRQWLPSFVLPRDPAIQRVLDGALPFLRALTDNREASFDGYQRQTGAGDADFMVVDQQVRAIWCSLLYEHPLAYINPPPTYTPNSQRLRAPSQILTEKRATCIDAALLLAACLEYIGIMPVIFLIPGHAFVGYWRSLDGREAKFKRFDAARTAFQYLTDEHQEISRKEAARRELLQIVQEGNVVPLESTEVMRQGSFATAIENGTKWLLLTPNLDAVIDVTMARENKITPLPLL